MSSASRVQNSSQNPTPAASLDVGATVRAMRLQRGLSLRELARRSGLAHAAISQIENNQVSPSVASLTKLVSALGQTLADFFGPDRTPNPPIFFPVETLVEIGASDVSLRLVGASLPHRALQLIHERYAPGADTGEEMLTHAGEEGGVVISGRVTITVGNETRVLGPGDAYQFASTRPHRFRNEGSEPCELVSASTPPSL